MLSLIREKRQELVIDLPARKLIWKGVELDMMPAKLAIYAFFAVRKRERDCTRRTCRGCDDCFLSIVDILDNQEAISAIYRKTGIDRDRSEMSDSGVHSQNFNSYKSKIRRELFGPYELKYLEIASKGRSPGVRYGIGLERERIRVVF
jgi:hypothetical protein